MKKTKAVRDFIKDTKVGTKQKELGKIDRKAKSFAKKLLK